MVLPVPNPLPFVGIGFVWLPGKERDSDENEPLTSHIPSAGQEPHTIFPQLCPLPGQHNATMPWSAESPAAAAQHFIRSPTG